MSKIREKLGSLFFKNQTTRQTIAKNVFWLTVSQIGSRFIRVIIIVYAARVLGAAEYGVFSYALGLAGFFTIFSDLGITSIVTREVAQKPEEKSYYFGTALWMKCILLAVTAILIITLAPFFSKIEEAKILIPLIALLSIADGLREFMLGFLRAQEKMEYEALVMTITNVSITAFGFLILAFSHTALALTSSYVGSVIVGMLAAAYIMRDELRKVLSHFDERLVRPILTSALPMTFIAVLGPFMLNTDVVMLGWWKSASDVGFYSAAQRIVQVLYTLPAIFASAAFPAIARLIGKNEDGKIRVVMEKGITLTILLALPVAIGGIILGKEIMQFLYGAEYLPGTASFQVLMLTPLLAFPGMLITNFIVAHDMQKKMIGTMLIGSFGNIILNAILIPPYGIIGSAVATITVQIVYNALNWHFAKKLNNFSVFSYLMKTVLASIAMGVIVFALNLLGLHVILTIIIGAAAYIASLFFLKEPLLMENLKSLRSKVEPSI